jgi:hypothetical protein
MYLHLWYNLAELLLKWEIFRDNLQIKSKHKFDVQYILFRKSCYVWNNVEKHGRARYNTDDDVTHVMCMLEK